MIAGQRMRVRGAGWVASCLLITGLAGCGGDDGGADAEASATSRTSAAEESETTGGTSPSTDPDISVAETIIELTVANGVPSPDVGQVAVPLGNTVRLFVTTDTADEIHVHGYELTLDLAAGVPAELTFVATIPGIFEVELHEGGQLLCELRVE